MIRISMLHSIMKIDLTGTIQFGLLPVEILTEHFKDGRWASTLLERYPSNFDDLSKTELSKHIYNYNMENWK